LQRQIGSKIRINLPERAIKFKKFILQIFMVGDLGRGAIGGDAEWQRHVTEPEES
jgi:hypothetical protein